jgi:hypothetical protein
LSISEKELRNRVSQFWKKVTVAAQDGDELRRWLTENGMSTELDPVSSIAPKLGAMVDTVAIAQNLIPEEAR